jgi:hypothetical protein
MKLTWHLIKNDAARDCGALLLWALLFVGQVVLGIAARNPREFDLNQTISLQMGNTGLVILQMVMGYFLVARLVQADTLAGTSAFWRTRPISPRRLLVAKALGAFLLFGLLPLLLLLPWWLYCGFGWREILWTGIETLGWQLLMIAPAFLIASMTDELGRLLLWSLMLLIGLVSWTLLLQVVFGSVEWRGRVIGPGAGVMYTRLWVGALVFVLGAGAVAVHHYLTRHLLRSIVLVVGWLGLICVAGRVITWNWSGSIATLAERKAEPIANPAERVLIKWESASGNMVRSIRKGVVSTEEARLQVLLRASGIPDDLRLDVQSAQQVWAWPGGTTLSRDGFFGNEYQSYSYADRDNPRAEVMRFRYSLPTPVEDEETRQALAVTQQKMDERARARGVNISRPLSLPEDQEGLLFAQTRVPNSLFAKMKAEPPAYEANLRCVLYRPEVTVEVPVADASDANGQGEGLHFRRVGKDDEALVMTLPSVRVSGLWLSNTVSQRTRSAQWKRKILQVNRVTGDVVVGRNFMRAQAQMVIAGVSLYWTVFDLKSPKSFRDGKMVSKYPEWQKDTFLAMVVEREVGRFDQTVKVEKFEVITEPDDR